jgi:hypothetical protein
MSDAFTPGVQGVDGGLTVDPRALALESQIRTAARAELARIGQLHRLDEVVAVAMRRVCP